MSLGRKILLIWLCNLLLCGVSFGQEKPQGDDASDWGVVERVRGSDDTTVVSDEEELDDADADAEEQTIETESVEAQDDTITEEPFEEEEIDYAPIVESVTKQTVEELGRKLVGGDKHDCLRCDKKNQLAVQVLGVKTLVGVTGIEMTRHIMSRTSVRGGIGYGFGGLTFGAAMLHYFREHNSLHLLTGLNISIKRKEEERDLEGLWLLIGLGSIFNTQVGINYGVDFGITMAALENVFSGKLRFCFGVLSQSSCREDWRIVPYITPIKIGYSF